MHIKQAATHTSVGVLGWVGSWKLGEYEQAAGIFSALCVGVYMLVMAGIAIKNMNKPKK
jgi:hypothetical protein